MTVRTAELAEILVEGITDGVPLRQLCRENGISKSEVYRWFDDDAELAGRIARARIIGFDQIAETALEIADDKAEEPASRRVRVETRLKLLAKWDPRRYGDKIGLVGGGPDDAPISIDMSRLNHEQLKALAAIRLEGDAEGR